MRAVVISCVVYGFQYGLGVRGLWVSMFDVFWFLFGVVFLGGGYHKYYFDDQATVYSIHKLRSYILLVRQNKISFIFQIAEPYNKFTLEQFMKAKGRAEVYLLFFF